MGSRIAAARSFLGLSQADLAAKEGCGGHGPRIAELEKGRIQNPGLVRVEALAKALEVDIAWLINGDPTRAPVWAPVSRASGEEH